MHKLSVLALALLALLASCTTTTGSSEGQMVASFCELAKPIAWSDADTSATIEAVKEHNAIGVAACGWKGH